MDFAEIRGFLDGFWCLKAAESLKSADFSMKSRDFAWNLQISSKIGKNPHFSLNLQEGDIKETVSFGNPQILLKSVDFYVKRKTTCL